MLSVLLLQPDIYFLLSANNYSIIKKATVANLSYRDLFIYSDITI